MFGCNLFPFNYSNPQYTTSNHSPASRQPTLKESKLAGAFSPVNPKGLRQGWKRTAVLSPSYSSHKSLFSKTTAQIIAIISERKVKKQWHILELFFFFFLFSAGTHYGNLHSTGRPILFCEPTQEPMLATTNTRKTRERFCEKMQVNVPEDRNLQRRYLWQQS